MSTHAPSSTAPPRDMALTDDDVAGYLHDHPDFFEQHAALLERLNLPHMAGTTAVSLVERQVAVLRESNDTLERKLRNLMSVARSNDALSGKLHALTLATMSASSADESLCALEKGLREEFGADQSTVILFTDDRRFAGVDRLGFVRQASSDCDALKPFRTFIAAALPRCGQIRDAQRAFLFGQDNLHIASTALVPIGANGQIGILAIGSQDSTRFHPGMGTEFLGRLGEILGVTLARHATSAAVA
ncbi:MAG: DUF484 family protein [Pseudomonadota bacterium]